MSDCQLGDWSLGQGELSLRLATDADLLLLNQLYGEMDGEGLLEVGVITDLWEQIRTLPNSDIYLAELAGQVVGTFTLLLLPTMMHRGFHRSALLDSVMVRPQCRAQGIGKAMVQAALGLAREAGCYKAMLSSNLTREPAHGFYRSLGFEQHGWSFSLLL